MEFTQLHYDSVDLIKKGTYIAETLAPQNLSLYSGKIGQLLLASYTYKLTNKERDWQKASALLDDILLQLQVQYSSMSLPKINLLMSLYNVLDVVRADEIAEVDLGEDALLLLDEVTYKSCLNHIKNQNIDFLYGAAGMFNYLINRIMCNPCVEGYLEALLKALLSVQIEDEKGVRFYNSHIARMNDSQDINLGLAHGQCGLILVLLKVHQAGVLQGELASLVSKMVKYMLFMRLVPESSKGYYSFYPARIDETKPHTHPENRVKYNSRMGWCYGDLDIALVLYRVHHTLQTPDMLHLANEVGLHASSRLSESESGVENAHLCHGSASMVLMYKALYKEMPLQGYKAATDFWLKATHGYLKEYYNRALHLSDPHAAGFLMGLPGILLVLISEQLSYKTSWERLLLV